MKKITSILLLLIIALNISAQNNVVVKSNGAANSKTDSTLAEKLSISDTSDMLSPYSQNLSRLSDSIALKLTSISKSRESDSVMQSKNGIISFAFRTKKVLNVIDFGAKGDMKSGVGSIPASSTTFTSATSIFASTDVGKTIRITGAGAAGGDLITTISGYTNSTTVTLATSAATADTSKAFDYGTENTAAIQAAANSVSTTGGTVYFPFGKYLISGSIDFKYPTIIEGEANGTHLETLDSSGNSYAPYSAIYEITANLPAAISIQSTGSIWKNLNLIASTGSVATSGVGLKINASSGSLYNSRFRYFYNTVVHTYSSYWRADRCIFQAVNIGISIQNDYNSDWGDYTIVDCWFNGSSAATPMTAIKIYGSGGAKIIGNKFNTVISTCIDVSIIGSTKSTSDLIVVGNSLENYKRCGISVYAASGGHFNNVLISGNQFAAYWNYTSGISLNSPTAANINRVTITGNILDGVMDNDTAIVLKGINGVNISGNSLTNWYRPPYIDAACKGVIAQTGEIVSTATSLTVTPSSNYYRVTATGQTITLPTAVGNGGVTYTVKLTAAGTCTIATTSSQAIDGSTTYSLSAQNKYVTVTSNNVGWDITANN